MRCPVSLCVFISLSFSCFCQCLRTIRTFDLLKRLAHIIKPYAVAYASSKRASIHLYIVFGSLFIYLGPQEAGRRAIRIKIKVKMNTHIMRGEMRTCTWVSDNGWRKKKKTRNIPWCVRVITIRIASNEKQSALLHFIAATVKRVPKTMESY